MHQSFVSQNKKHTAYELFHEQAHPYLHGNDQLESLFAVIP